MRPERMPYVCRSVPANDNRAPWSFSDALKRAKRLRIDGVPFGSICVDEHAPSEGSASAYVQRRGRRWFLFVASDYTLPETTEALRAACERFGEFTRQVAQ